MGNFLIFNSELYARSTENTTLAQGSRIERLDGLSQFFVYKSFEIRSTSKPIVFVRTIFFCH